MRSFQRSRCSVELSHTGLFYTDSGQVKEDRQEAADLLENMPAFPWKAKLVQIARAHGGSRRGRRATEAVLRAYGTWLARVERDRARQAREKVAREARQRDRIVKRWERGCDRPLPRGYPETDANQCLIEELRTPIYF